MIKYNFIRIVFNFINFNKLQLNNGFLYMPRMYTFKLFDIYNNITIQ